MNPKKIERKLFTRMIWIGKTLKDLQSLPLDNYETFIADEGKLLNAKGYLRRGIESLLDLGKCILENRFSIIVSQYQEIPVKLEENAVLTEQESILLKTLADYCEYLANSFEEIGKEELYKICKQQIDNLFQIKSAYSRWIENNSKMELTLH
jgi:uncharacterized protein YutE (UPF0331/DUF86 family)